MKIKVPQSRPVGLVGRFFHSLCGDKIEWQGYVKDKAIEEGWYIVALFSWIDGFESVERLVHIDQMKDWRFYYDREWMVNAYEEYNAQMTAQEKRESYKKGK